MNIDRIVHVVAGTFILAFGWFAWRRLGALRVPDNARP